MKHLHLFIAVPSVLALFWGCTYYKSQHYKKEFTGREDKLFVTASLQIVDDQKSVLVTTASAKEMCNYSTTKTYFKPYDVSWSEVHVYVKEEKQFAEECGKSDEKAFANQPVSLCIHKREACVDVGTLSSTGRLSKELMHLFLGPEDFDDLITVRIRFKNKFLRKKVLLSEDARATYTKLYEERLRLDKLKAETLARLRESTDAKEVYSAFLVVLANQFLTDEEALDLLKSRSEVFNEAQVEHLSSADTLEKHPQLKTFFVEEHESRMRVIATRDSDGDGIPDAQDKCPDEAETINGVEDEDGCPDQGAARIVVTTEQIKLLDKIYFENDKDIIKPVSYSLLDQVALALKANANILEIEIQGHAGTNGEEEHNFRLSEARAKAVRTYLVNKGISPSRLVARWYGVTRPVRRCSSRLLRKERLECEEDNRRVEFIILKREERLVR